MAISGKLVLEWVNHVDLMRIDGVGSQYADLLSAAGVDSRAELARRNAANLATTFQEVVAARPTIVRGFRPRKPSPAGSSRRRRSRRWSRTSCRPRGLWDTRPDRQGPASPGPHRAGPASPGSRGARSRVARSCIGPRRRAASPGPASPGPRRQVPRRQVLHRAAVRTIRRRSSTPRPPGRPGDHRSAPPGPSRPATRTGGRTSATNGPPGGRRGLGAAAAWAPPRPGRRTRRGRRRGLGGVARRGTRAGSPEGAPERRGLPGLPARVAERRQRDPGHGA